MRKLLLALLLAVTPAFAAPLIGNLTIGDTTLYLSDEKCDAQTADVLNEPYASDSYIVYVRANRKIVQTDGCYVVVGTTVVLFDRNGPLNAYPIRDVDQGV